MRQTTASRQHTASRMTKACMRASLPSAMKVRRLKPRPGAPGCSSCALLRIPPTSLPSPRSLSARPRLSAAGHLRFSAAPRGVALPPPRPKRTHEFCGHARPTRRATWAPPAADKGLPSVSLLGRPARRALTASSPPPIWHDPSARGCAAGTVATQLRLRRTLIAIQIRRRGAHRGFGVLHGLHVAGGSAAAGALALLARVLPAILVRRGCHPEAHKLARSRTGGRSNAAAGAADRAAQGAGARRAGSEGWEAGRGGAEARRERGSGERGGEARAPLGRREAGGGREEGGREGRRLRTGRASSRRPRLPPGEANARGKVGDPRDREGSAPTRKWGEGREDAPGSRIRP